MNLYCNNHIRCFMANFRKCDLKSNVFVASVSRLANTLRQPFNLEAAAQSQAVARINALAFVFLPLSTVAVCRPPKSIENPI